MQALVEVVRVRQHTTGTAHLQAGSSSFSRRQECAAGTVVQAGSRRCQRERVHVYGRALPL